MQAIEGKPLRCRDVIRKIEGTLKRTICHVEHAHGIGHDARYVGQTLRIVEDDTHPLQGVVHIGAAEHGLVEDVVPLLIGSQRLVDEPHDVTPIGVADLEGQLVSVVAKGGMDGQFDSPVRVPRSPLKTV